MKSTYILCAVILILTGSLIYGSARTVKLERDINTVQNQFDTMATLAKDVSEVAKAWQHKYDSVVIAKDSCACLTGSISITHSNNTVTTVGNANTVNIGN